MCGKALVCLAKIPARTSSYAKATAHADQPYTVHRPYLATQRVKLFATSSRPLPFTLSAALLAATLAALLALLPVLLVVLATLSALFRTAACVALLVLFVWHVSP